VPTYPYACTACGHAFEVQQSFSDPALTECPECSGRLRKVYSSVGVVFKGSGFYRTDSRSGSTSSTPASSSSSDAGKGGDAKPAAKSDGGTTSSTTSSAKPASAAAAGS